MQEQVSQYFTKITTNRYEKLWIKKNSNNINYPHYCCSFDYDYNHKTNIYTYSKCQELITDGFVCNKHQKNTITFLHNETKNNSFKKTLCKGRKLGKFRFFNVSYLPNKNCFIFYFFSQKHLHAEFLFKGFTYDFKNVIKIISTMYNHHDSQILAIKLEPYYFIHKNITKLILSNTGNFCNDILPIISNSLFYKDDSFLYSCFIFYIKDELNKKHPIERAETILHLFVHLFKHYNYLLKDPNFKNSLLIYYTRNKDQLKFLLQITQNASKQNIENYDFLVQKINSISE
jgi:hypothetical protein